MEFSNLDPMALATLLLFIAGSVELLKRLMDKDYRTAGIIAVSSIVGALFAPHVGGNISWVSGLAVGLAASGLVTVTTRIGGSK